MYLIIILPLICLKNAYIHKVWEVLENFRNMDRMRAFPEDLNEISCEFFCFELDMKDVPNLRYTNAKGGIFQTHGQSLQQDSAWLLSHLGLAFSVKLLKLDAFCSFTLLYIMRSGRLQRIRHKKLGSCHIKTVALLVSPGCSIHQRLSKLIEYSHIESQIKGHCPLPV